MHLKIDEEFKKLIPPLSDEEFKQLEENILAEGIRDKVLTWENTIIDGHNRFSIAQKYSINFDVLQKEFESRDDVIVWIINNQLGRRNLPEYTKLELYGEKKKVLIRQGREKQGARTDLLSNNDKMLEPDKHDTRKIIANELGMSTGKVAMFEVLDKKAPEEIKEKLRKEEMTISGAYKELQKEEKKEKNKVMIEQLKQKEVAPPTGLYDVIVIDPPWQMEKIEREVAPDQVGFDYPTMSIDEIKNFKLPAEKDCHVFMWITQKHLPFGFEILKAWESKYVCTFVWHKNGGFQPFGLPQYNCEFVLYARIGTPQFIDFKSFFTCFNANRTGHSEKPEEFYQLVRRVTAGKKIDIFNRRDIEGFEKWGNEA